MSFTALCKPALRVVEQALSKLTLPQKVKIIKEIAHALMPLNEVGNGCIFYGLPQAKLF